MKYLFSTLFTTLLLTFSFSQVPVTINSGNPKFPFPQFSPYKHGANHELGNLGTKNPVGVTHAEMEQRARDAWQIMANAFIYSGETYKGIKYIKGNVGCPYDCSEGSGYAMLGAAYMADKAIFDGLWMRNHDIRLTDTPRYSDCVVNRPGYQYGKNTLAEPSGDAAADGSFDMALALLVAWKQWGEFMGIDDACGNPISYKAEALKIIKGLVEKQNSGYNDCRSVTGCIGLDGYVKNGNTWGETTSWANNKLDTCPEFQGPQDLHVDYMAPAYFNEFRSFLTSQGESAWNINQFLRAEASSDWIMKKSIENPKGIPFAGWGKVNNDQVTFSNFNEGEDFRLSWRTNLNHVWHGNPSFTWDPITHQIIKDSTNTYEKDVAARYAYFLKNYTDSPWNNSCANPGGYPSMTFKGTSELTSFDINGTKTWPLPNNWIIGAASSTVVSAQDYQLMAEFYRQCVIEFDYTKQGDGYLTSTPGYFHGWFRLLGMLTLTGNFQAPDQMIPKANLKVYQSVSNTAAKLNDTIKYTIDYRNYGSVAASGTQVTTTIDPSYQVLSISNAGVLTGNTIKWTIGTVAGFNGSNLANTIGSISFMVIVKNGSRKSICSSATISATNSVTHISNEYPNNISAVMERNCVDILPNPIKITSVIDSLNLLDNNESLVTINFENQKSASLTGGRPNVFLSYGNDNSAKNGAVNYFKARIFHGADEPYIDYGNYRFSLFLHDTTYNCLQNSVNCNANKAFSLSNQVYEGGISTDAKYSIEPLLAGSDAQGSWNQKLTIQMGHALATVTPHLSRYYGITGGGRIHEGVAYPFRGKWMFNASTYASVNWGNDWSWSDNALSNDSDNYWPVSPSYTTSSVTPVQIWHPDACEKPTKNIENVLVEEWDGHVWRKIYGNAPVEGQAQTDFVIRDTLPESLEFVGFVDSKAFQYSATYNPTTRIIELKIPILHIGAKEEISYKVKAFKQEECPSDTESVKSSVVFLSKEQTKTNAQYATHIYCDKVTGINSETSVSYEIFPNPTLTGFTVSSNDENLSFELIDMSGKIIEKGAVTDKLVGTNLETGTYIIRLTSENNTFTQLIQKR